MKYKVLALSVLSVIIYSCASKSGVASSDSNKTETTAATKATVLTPELAEGKSLYENNCAKCHKLYDTKAFSAEEWKPIVARMQKKAHLDELSGQKIYNYVSMQ